MPNWAKEAVRKKHEWDPLAMERGTLEGKLIDFLEEKRQFAMNMFFKKKPQRKWTWISPNGKTRNKIVYILSNEKSMSKRCYESQQIYNSGDDRLVRAKVVMNSNLEIKKKHENKEKRTDMLKLRERKQATNCSALLKHFSLFGR